MKEYSLIMIKPHAIKLAKDIFRDLDKHGKSLCSRYIESLPLEELKLHYEQLRDKIFYYPMIEDMVKKSAHLSIYEGEQGLIEMFRTIVGPTNPFDASKDTIRGKYRNCGGILISKITNGQIIRNFVHCSDSPERAKREIEIWSRFFAPKFVEKATDF